MAAGCDICQIDAVSNKVACVFDLFDLCSFGRRAFPAFHFHASKGSTFLVSLVSACSLLLCQDEHRGSCV